jgi:hypothetical protein
MTTKRCRKTGRKHTPIVSRQQQRLFGAELRRKRAGQKGRTGMSRATLKRHLTESRGKKLPTRTRRKK